ncbi:MAG: hypothetical protein QXL17_04185 [Candidatus Thermoplasmatota archaeon]
MAPEHTLEEIRKKAHSVNCALFEEGYSPREIEILGYYLHRIAASYLSYFTHKEYDRTLNDDSVFDESAKEEYKHL